MSQLEDNLKAADLELTTDEVEQLSGTTAPAPIYPEWMIERQNAGRVKPVESESSGEALGAVARP